MEHPDAPWHVAACAECQANAANAVQESMDVDLERVWTGVTASIWAPRVGPVERLAARLLGSPGLARALVTTPSLLLSWIVASAAVLAVGAMVTRATGTPWVALLAPAVAGAGIAYAYGPGIDPAFELSQSMAVSDRLVLLVRGLAVFGLNAALGIVASLFATSAAGITLGWLLPMTAVSALALAVAALARSANAGVVAALAGWCIVVLGADAGTRDLAAAVMQAELTPGYALGTIICLGLALYATAGEKSVARGWP